jgi:hypothetical protein
MTLATLAQLKTHLNWKASDTTNDAKLTMFLNAGSAWVESYCERKFESASYTERSNGNATTMLTPRNWPITAVTELRISSDRDWASGLVPSTDYAITSDEMNIQYFNGLFPIGLDNVRIIYTAGYSTIPNDLVMANLWASEWFYLHNNRGDSGRTTASKMGESVGILAEIPMMIKQMLQPYRRFEAVSIDVGRI